MRKKKRRSRGKGIGLSPEGLEEWKQITKNITLRDNKGKVMKVKGSGILEDLQKNYIDPYQPEIKYGIDYAKNRFPDAYGPVRNVIRGDVLKGRGNFWGDIEPATTYLRPAGDALLDKKVEKLKD